MWEEMQQRASGLIQARAAAEDLASSAWVTCSTSRAVRTPVRPFLTNEPHLRYTCREAEREFATVTLQKRTERTITPRVAT